MKPVWLLDIDGVVNVAAIWLRRPDLVEPPPEAWPLEDWVDTKSWASQQQWRILAANPVLEFIRQVHNSGLAEIRWHTTWQEMANNVSKVLDLPEFTIQEAPEFLRYVRREWWKLPAVWRVLSEGRRVVWTDDDATELSDQQRLALEATGCHLVIPDPTLGLTQQNLDSIREFLTRE